MAHCLVRVGTAQARKAGYHFYVELRAHKRLPLQTTLAHTIFTIWLPGETAFVPKSGLYYGKWQ